MWLVVKIKSPFGYPKFKVPNYIKDANRYHNFDNHPCLSSVFLRFVVRVNWFRCLHHALWEVHR